MATLSENLTRIKNATDSIRNVVNESGVIEDVATAVSDLNNEKIALEEEIERIRPSGTINIGTSGTFDVSRYEYADVELDDSSVLNQYFDINLEYTSNWRDMQKQPIEYVANGYSNLAGMFADYPFNSIKITGTFGKPSNNSLYNMFANTPNLTNVQIPTINSEDVTDFQGMFMGCNMPINTMQNIINNLDTSSAAAMNNFLQTQWRYETIDLSHFDTSNVESFGGMLGWSNLNVIGYEDFDVSKGIDFTYMFCNGLNLSQPSGDNGENKILDLSNWQSNLVQNLSYFCADDWGLKKIYMPNLSFVTEEEYIYCSAMFSNCVRLTYADVRNLEFSNTFENWDIFNQVSPYCCIIVKNNTEKEYLLNTYSNFQQIYTASEYEENNDLYTTVTINLQDDEGNSWAGIDTSNVYYSIYIEDENDPGNYISCWSVDLGNEQHYYEDDETIILPYGKNYKIVAGYMGWENTEDYFTTDSTTEEITLTVHGPVPETYSNIIVTAVDENGNAIQDWSLYYTIDDSTAGTSDSFSYDGSNPRSFSLIDGHFYSIWVYCDGYIGNGYGLTVNGDEEIEIMLSQPEPSNDVVFDATFDPGEDGTRKNVRLYKCDSEGNNIDEIYSTNTTDSSISITINQNQLTNGDYYHIYLEVLEEVQYSEVVQYDESTTYYNMGTIEWSGSPTYEIYLKVFDHEGQRTTCDNISYEYSNISLGGESITGSTIIDGATVYTMNVIGGQPGRFLAYNEYGEGHWEVMNPEETGKDWNSIITINSGIRTNHDVIYLEMRGDLAADWTYTNNTSHNLTNPRLTGYKRVDEDDQRTEGLEMTFHTDEENSNIPFHMSLLDSSDNVITGQLVEVSCDGEGYARGTLVYPLIGIDNITQMNIYDISPVYQYNNNLDSDVSNVVNIWEDRTIGGNPIAGYEANSVFHNTLCCNNDSTGNIDDVEIMLEYSDSTTEIIGRVSAGEWGTLLAPFDTFEINEQPAGTTITQLILNGGNYTPYEEIEDLTDSVTISFDTAYQLDQSNPIKSFVYSSLTDTTSIDINIERVSNTDNNFISCQMYSSAGDDYNRGLELNNNKIAFHSEAMGRLESLYFYTFGNQYPEMDCNTASIPDTGTRAVSIGTCTNYNIVEFLESVDYNIMSRILAAVIEAGANTEVYALMDGTNDGEPFSLLGNLYYYDASSMRFVTTNYGSYGIQGYYDSEAGEERIRIIQL